MKLFLPQSTLEDWIVSNRADLLNEQLILNGEETSTSYRVTPAVHFRSLISGNDDKNLLGKVQSIRRLTDLKIEYMATSCIDGESAYEVDAGYIAELITAPEK